MQNMQRYFGFRVIINNDLDPEIEKRLKARALEIIDIDKLDPADYHVYLHQLFIKAAHSHFNVSGGLSKRINELNIDFHINRAEGKRRHQIYESQV